MINQDNIHVLETKIDFQNLIKPGDLLFFSENRWEIGISQYKDKHGLFEPFEYARYSIKSFEYKNYDLNLGMSLELEFSKKDIGLMYLKKTEKNLLPYTVLQVDIYNKPSWLSAPSINTYTNPEDYFRQLYHSYNKSHDLVNNKLLLTYNITYNFLYGKEEVLFHNFYYKVPKDWDHKNESIIFDDTLCFFAYPIIFELA